MKPYIAKQPKQTRERIEVKLEAGLARKLESYCQYLESYRDYVLSQALEIVFRKDKAFADWLASQSESIPARSPSTGRSDDASHRA